MKRTLFKGLSEYEAQLKAKEVNVQFSIEKEENRQEAINKAEQVVFYKLLHYVEFYNEYDMIVAPNDNEFFKNYFTSSKFSNVHLGCINVDVNELSNTQHYDFEEADVDSYSESESGSVTGFTVSQTSSGYSASPDYGPSISTTYYRVISKRRTDSVICTLRFKLVKRGTATRVIEKERQYAPLYIKHTNHQIYEKNKKKRVTKFDCNFNAWTCLVATICAVLFNLFAIIDTILMVLNAYNISGGTEAYRYLNNVVTGTSFIVIAGVLFLLQFIGFLTACAYKIKFRCYNKMNKNGECLDHFKWDSFAVIYSAISIGASIFGVAAILMDNYAPIFALICIFVIVSAIAAIFSFIESVIEVKEDFNYYGWDSFEASMRKFNNLGELKKCEKLVAEIKSYTMQII